MPVDGGRENREASKICKVSTFFKEPVMCLQVMSRGRVVNAGTSESVYFSLSPDQTWTPLACILVYYTLPDGEIVNDALQVTFTQVLTNTVRAQIITFMTSCVL